MEPELKMAGVDAVIVGCGWTGAVMAERLTAAGLNVLALERGPWRDTSADFATTFDQDELRYFWRQHLFQNVAHDTITFRNHLDEMALPMRRLGSFLPGTGVGGGGVHWNGQTWRFLPSDLIARTHNEQRYGTSAIPEEMTIEDFGVTYEELEPHYDRFEYICGVSGKAGNLNGRIVDGGNPFEGPRAREYPNPPLDMTYGPTLFAKAATEAGYHPFPQPASNMSRAYVNPLGMQIGQCSYCGFCEKFGCGNYSKSSPQTTILPVLLRRPNFTLQTGAEVLNIDLDSTKRRATGVTYVDASGSRQSQSAEIVLLSAFMLQNVRLLLLSGIGTPYNPTTGEGVVGKNYSYQIMSSVNVFFKDKLMNPFIGAGALGIMIDDFNGDNFDHSGLGFIGGGYLGVLNTGARPIETHPVPEGTPGWGSRWKRAVASNYLKTTSLMVHGAVMSHRANYVDLDPHYTDDYGRPLLRMTFDFTKNEHRMSDYLTDRAADIARRMGAREIRTNRRTGAYSIMPYQTTHNTGGAIMGSNPRASVVNKYLQSWDVPNLFVLGSSAFPQQAGYNPLGTAAALTYHCADAITSRYVKSPGPLVSA